MSHSIIFFGSFQHYSVQVLDRLTTANQCDLVVTTPPAPKGRGLELFKTPVHEYAESHNLPLITPENLNTDPHVISNNPPVISNNPPVISNNPPVISNEVRNLNRPDFLIVAGYGKLIPAPWLKFPKIMAINLHPSLLPKYRGRFPVEWAMIRGETETGVTLIEMSPEFDKGKILVQDKFPIAPDDTSVTLYTKLFNLGADLLTRSLPQIAAGKITPIPQPEGKFFYAKGFIREDGFIPWELLQKAIRGEDIPKPERPGIFKLTTNNWPSTLDHAIRALNPWPGIWTIQPSNKRLKLLTASYHPTSHKLEPQLVQEESKTPASWKS